MPSTRSPAAPKARPRAKTVRPQPRGRLVRCADCKHRVRLPRGHRGDGLICSQCGAKVDLRRRTRPAPSAEQAEERLVASRRRAAGKRRCRACDAAIPHGEKRCACGALAPVERSALRHKLEVVRAREAEQAEGDHFATTVWNGGVVAGLVCIVLGVVIFGLALLGGYIWPYPLIISVLGLGAVGRGAFSALTGRGDSPGAPRPSRD